MMTTFPRDKLRDILLEIRDEQGETNLLVKLELILDVATQMESEIHLNAEALDFLQIYI